MAVEFNFNVSGRFGPREVDPRPGRWVAWLLAAGAIAREAWRWFG